MFRAGVPEYTKIRPGNDGTGICKVEISPVAGEIGAGCGPHLTGILKIYVAPPNWTVTIQEYCATLFIKNVRFIQSLRTIRKWEKQRMEKVSSTIL